MRNIRDERQAQSMRWALSCFPSIEVQSVAQRILRHIEEAFEMAQICQLSQKKIIIALAHVYAKPIGIPRQELGGMSLTLLVLASALRLSADECESEELQRVLSKPPEYFTARNAAKNIAGLSALDVELFHQDTIEENLLASANDLATQLQEQRDIVAKYKEKFGEL